MDTYTFSVSEVLPDGRILVTTYVRIDSEISVTMTAYDDLTMQTGKRYLNVQLKNESGQLPVVR